MQLNLMNKILLRINSKLKNVCLQCLVELKKAIMLHHVIESSHTASLTLYYLVKKILNYANTHHIYLIWK